MPCRVTLTLKPIPSTPERLIEAAAFCRTSGVRTGGGIDRGWKLLQQLIAIGPRGFECFLGRAVFLVGEELCIGLILSLNADLPAVGGVHVNTKNIAFFFGEGLFFRRHDPPGRW